MPLSLACPEMTFCYRFAVALWIMGPQTITCLHPRACVEGGEIEGDHSAPPLPPHTHLDQQAGHTQDTALETTKDMETSCTATVSN